MKTMLFAVAAACLALCGTRGTVWAQATPSPAAPQTPPRAATAFLLSPEVLPDRRLTFRISAPHGESVKLRAGDIPGNGNTPLTKNADGVWEVTVGPVEPGAYRYTFDVDGVSTVDPRNPVISESNNNVWSLVTVPGSEWMDTKADIPHGAVSAVTYYSTALSQFRRLHVYLPPGYESGDRTKYPVLYLLHGSGDSDEAWTSVGRAGIILDNLIAAHKARPMIVVMPAGHVRPAVPGTRPAPDAFEQDFLRDVVPLIEKNYRVRAETKSRAVAGLSMGGGQSLNLLLMRPGMFGYVGVFSAGFFPAFRRPEGGTAPSPTSWEDQHRAELDNPDEKKDLRLLWFRIGKDDGLLPVARGTVDLLKRHGFEPVYDESTGAHTWLNWRSYLIAFVPQLFP